MKYSKPNHEPKLSSISKSTLLTVQLSVHASGKNLVHSFRVSMITDQENQPLLSTVSDNGAHHQKNCCSSGMYSALKQIFQKYKAVLLILVWTVIVGELFTCQQAVIRLFIDEYVPTGDNHFANSVSSPLAFANVILAVIAMLYPLSGFLADVYCGRFKTVMVGLSFLLLYIVIGIIVAVWAGTKRAHPLLEDYTFTQVAPFYFVGFGVFSLAVLGIIAFQANFIQLGLDQLMDAPSRNLSVFIHLAVWSHTIGIVIAGTSLAFGCCQTLKVSIKTAFTAMPLSISLISLPVIFIFSCYKRRWFYTESGQCNPYNNVFKVLNFVRKHRYPLQRSAFTYCGDEGHSRMDFAKTRYGGPFTTEQVEDVKTFLRILSLIFSLGAIFVMEILTLSTGFITFGLHTGYGGDTIRRCTVWAILESSILQYITGSIFLPIYTYIMFVSIGRHVSLFTRLYAGLLFYILGAVSMLAIDLAGHLHYVNDQGTGSHCMFTYTRANNANALKYPVLEMHWAVLIPPNVLFGLGAPVIMATVLEFISAQSPHSMKGFLIGVFFAIKGFFQLISSITLVPISSDSIWSKGSMRQHPPVTNCCFAYFLFTIFFALLGLILFSAVVKRYKYRERDERPYDQSVVEEIFYRRTLMRSQTPDYQDLDA